YVDGRTFTATFLTTDDLNDSAFSIALGRGADLGANPVFVLYDNISLDVSVVSVVPEPSAALLGGIGALALLRRRRACSPRSRFPSTSHPDRTPSRSGPEPVPLHCFASP